MDIAIGLLRVYMKRGVIDEMILTPLFEYFFQSFPDLTQEQQMAIFMDITGMYSPNDYPNTWVDMEFPVDDDGNPVHPKFLIAK